jgi:hypothetical protein
MRISCRGSTVEITAEAMKADRDEDVPVRYSSPLTVGRLRGDRADAKPGVDALVRKE